jgi:hypothetical protein
MQQIAAQRWASRPRFTYVVDPAIAARVWLALIAVLAVGTMAIVWRTGGSPNAFNHLGYVPIGLAAYRFGWRASLPTAVLVAALLGPVGDVLGMPNEGWQAWTTRGVIFLGMGVALGLLFDRMRILLVAALDHAEVNRGNQRAAMLAFARGAEAKDEQTGQHVARVKDNSMALAEAIGLDASEADAIGLAAMLHDVGKLHVPDSILLKPGPLDPDEWAIMKMHPIWGERILGDSEFFGRARHIARWHHENFDGSGYPDGLRADAIPIEARIVRLADAFDAMTNRRPYAAPRSIAQALEEIERYAGRQFDPELARVFIALLESDLVRLTKAA